MIDGQKVGHFLITIQKSYKLTSYGHAIVILTKVD